MRHDLKDREQNSQSIVFECFNMYSACFALPVADQLIEMPKSEKVRVLISHKLHCTNAINSKFPELQKA